MEVCTCDSVSYVVCRNLAFLMLDLVTHTVFNEAMHSIEERQFIELTEIKHYNWQHTEKTEYNACEPTIYHYKKINRDIKLTNIEKCPNDK